MRRKTTENFVYNKLTELCIFIFNNNSNLSNFSQHQKIKETLKPANEDITLTYKLI